MSDDITRQSPVPLIESPIQSEERLNPTQLDQSENKPTLDNTTNHNNPPKNNKNQQYRRQNRDTTTNHPNNYSKEANNHGNGNNKHNHPPNRPQTFGAYSIVEHSNLLRNAVIQAKNSPYIFYSSYYAVVPRDAVAETANGNECTMNDDDSSLSTNPTSLTTSNTKLHPLPTPSFNEYLELSLDEMFCAAYEEQNKGLCDPS